MARRGHPFRGSELVANDEQFAIVAGSEHIREATRAFAEKRAPNWRGVWSSCDGRSWIRCPRSTVAGGREGSCGIFDVEDGRLDADDGLPRVQPRALWIDGRGDVGPLRRRGMR